MLSAGLRGETKSEVLTLLGCKDEDFLHKMCRALLANKELPLKVANKCLVDHKFEVVKEYNEFLKVSSCPT